MALKDNLPVNLGDLHQCTAENILAHSLFSTASWFDLSSRLHLF